MFSDDDDDSVLSFMSMNYDDSVLSFVHDDGVKFLVTLISVIVSKVVNLR